MSATASPVIDRKWKGFIDEETIRRLDSIPFLTRCRAGTATRKELRDFVAQQYHYSKHFPRYLCALLANVGNEADRLRLTENLFEESGFAGGDGRPHSQIYRDMMKRMGISPDQELVRPATKALVDTMFDRCRCANPMVGLGALCLGAEAIVPHVYNQVVNGFLSVGESGENLEFFRIHIECDDDHAETMYEIIERELEADPKQRGPLKAAARDAIEARRDFFGSIQPEVIRRFPQVPGGMFYEQVLI